MPENIDEVVYLDTLINLVSRKVFLYHMGHSDYKNTTLHNETFEVIASKIYEIHGVSLLGEPLVSNIKHFLIITDYINTLCRRGSLYQMERSQGLVQEQIFRKEKTAYRFGCKEVSSRRPL